MNFEITDFKYWTDALNGIFGEIHEAAPRCGYYRKRTKGESDKPVAIWRKGGDIVGTIDGEEIDPATIWTWVANSPVTETAFNERVNTGIWPGEIAGMGHNDPPEDLSIDELTSEITEIIRITKYNVGLGPVTTQIACDECANLKDRANALKNTANAIRTTEKAPHLAAGKEVDAKWNPLIDIATEAAADLGRAITPYLQQKEAVAVEKAAQAEKAGERIPTTKAHAGGAMGRRTGLRTSLAAEITDYDKAVQSLKSHDYVRDAVQKAANAFARNKIAMDGFKIVKIQKA